MSEATETPLWVSHQVGKDPYSVPLETIDVADFELFETDELWGWFKRLRYGALQAIGLGFVAGAVETVGLAASSKLPLSLIEAVGMGLVAMFLMGIVGGILGVESLLATDGSLGLPPWAATFLTPALWIILPFMIIVSLPGLVAGVGLIARRRWAWKLGLVVALCQLPLFPLGSVLGYFTLSVLLSQDAEAVFGADERRDHGDKLKPVA